MISRVASSVPVPGTETRWARCGKSQVWSQRTLVLCSRVLGLFDNIHQITGML